MFEHNHNSSNYDHLIGKIVRGSNYTIMGEIITIDYSDDGYRHQNAFAVLDNGNRINCRRLEKRKR